MKGIFGFEVGTGGQHERFIGAAIVGADLVSVDLDGVLWRLATGPCKDLVRWCLDRGVRVFDGLGELVGAIDRGTAIGLLPHLAGRVARPVGML